MFIFVILNEKTMGSITQEAFTALIEAVRLQTLKDRSNAITLGEVFNTDGINPYDNSILIKAIVSYLQLHFPKKDNHCEIEHYMFDMNFGQIGEQELVTIENLWDRLNNQQLHPEVVLKAWITKEEAANNDLNYQHLISTHPLID